MEGVGKEHIGFDVLLGYRITESFRKGGTVGCTAHSSFRQRGVVVVLGVSILDMGIEFSLMADEVFSSAQKITSCSHVSWIDIGYREHTTSEHGSDLFRIDEVVL